MDANENDLILVRDILVREIETINFYHRLLEQAQGDDARSFLKHIIEEEKEHVAEAFMLINQHDPNQAALFQSGNHWRESNQAPDSKADRVEAAATVQPDNSSTRLTVGSLRES